MLEQTLKISTAIVVFAVGVTVFLGPSLEQKTSVSNSAPAKAYVSTLAPVSSQYQTTGSARGTEYLDADANGHFSANVEVNGIEVKTLVDTGATMVAFGAADAERAGIRPVLSDYKYKTQTANGEVSMARVVVRRMRLGTIEIENVEAAVLPEGALSGTLLGMTFLRKLQVQTENGRMVLKQQ